MNRLYHICNNLSVAWVQIDVHSSDLYSDAGSDSYDGDLYDYRFPVSKVSWNFADCNIPHVSRCCCCNWASRLNNRDCSINICAFAEFKEMHVQMCLVQSVTQTPSFELSPNRTRIGTQMPLELWKNLVNDFPVCFCLSTWVSELWSRNHILAMSEFVHQISPPADVGF